MPRIDQLVDIGRNDVLVIFDYRRYQADTIDFARRAKERGATIVLITDPWLAPIADIARHVVLPTSVMAPSPFDSLVAGMAIVETLVAALSARLAEDGRSRIARMDTLREGFVLDEGAGYQLSATSYQLSAISHQPESSSREVEKKSARRQDGMTARRREEPTAKSR
jgi:hypothetical protein